MLNRIYSIMSSLYVGFYSTMAVFFSSSVYAVVHTLSFEDTTEVTKKIGIFTKRRKVSTNFRRH